MGGFFAQYFGPHTRAVLFYGICIWVRLGLAVGLGFAIHAAQTTTLAVVLAGAIIYAAVQCTLTHPVWWNRRVHSIIGMVVAAAAAIGLAVPAGVYVYLVPILVGLDVVWGIGHSLVVHPFDHTDVDVSLL
jgi:hypothetical protein